MQYPHKLGLRNRCHLLHSNLHLRYKNMLFSADYHKIQVHYLYFAYLSLLIKAPLVQNSLEQRYDVSLKGIVKAESHNLETTLKHPC